MSGKSVYLVVGDDEFLATAKAKELVEQLVPAAERTFGLETAEGRVDTVDEALTALRSCIDAMRTVGFLGGRKLVWLRDATLLGDAVISGSQPVKDLVAELVEMIREGLAPGQTLVITAPKLDKRSALYKACADKGEIHEFAMPEKAYQADSHAKEQAAVYLRRAGLQMSETVLESFLTRVGTETRQIAAEIEKLSVYLAERKEVKQEDVTLLVSASRELAVWDFADAVASRDWPRSAGVLRQLLFQKESPILVLTFLEKRVREMLVVREMLDKGWARVRQSERWTGVDWNLPPEVEESLSALDKDNPRQFHPYRLGRLAVAASGVPFARLVQWRSLILRAHEQIVSSSVPQDIALEVLLFSLMGIARGQAGGVNRAGA